MPQMPSCFVRGCSGRGLRPKGIVRLKDGENSMTIAANVVADLRMITVINDLAPFHEA
jgi:hypothetical protein